MICGRHLSFNLIKGSFWSTVVCQSRLMHDDWWCCWLAAAASNNNNGRQAVTGMQGSQPASQAKPTSSANRSYCSFCAWLVYLQGIWRVTIFIIVRKVKVTQCLHTTTQLTGSPEKRVPPTDKSKQSQLRMHYILFVNQALLSSKSNCGYWPILCHIRVNCEVTGKTLTVKSTDRKQHLINKLTMEISSKIPITLY